jgi:hypothetical protein
MKIVRILVIITLFVSCKHSSSKAGFCIEENLLYYNGNQIVKNDSIKNIVKVIGHYDRIVSDSVINVREDWTWQSNIISAYKCSYDKKVNVFDEKSKKFIEFNTIGEVEEKYGKFDNYNKEKTCMGVLKYYIWDELGVYLVVEENDKTLFLLNLNLFNPDKIIKDEKNNQRFIDRKIPKNEYKGKFSYNGNTVDFAEMEYNNWSKILKTLKITESSESWGKMVNEKKLPFSLNRFNDTISVGNVVPVNKIKKIDCIKNIEIWPIMFVKLIKPSPEID